MDRVEIVTAIYGTDPAGDVNLNSRAVSPEIVEGMAAVLAELLRRTAVTPPPERLHSEPSTTRP